VPRQESHRSGFAAVRQRERGISARRRRGGDARDDFEINPMRSEVVHLFAETTEDTRITALETHDEPALTCFTHENDVDLILGHRVDPTALTDRHDLRRSRNLCQQGIAREGIMNDDVSSLEQTEAPHGDQIGSPRSGTDEDHPAYVAIYHLFKLDPIYVILGNLIKY
jgi:hypothetical protein